MKLRLFLSVFLFFSVFHNSLWSATTISGELKKWHKVTLLFDGPSSSESAATNPFTEYRLIVTFTNGAKSYNVPGHYAADGDAAETSSFSGDKWRVYFTPDETGTWNYSVSFRTGTMIAISDVANAGTAVAPLNGESGSFTVAASDKTGNDFRAKGRLAYVGEHYLRFSETGEYFIKGGTDSPENFLAYWEFDQTSDASSNNHPPDLYSPVLDNQGLHHYAPHVADWKTGDPSWQGGKGKGIIGALNYLASKGVNSVYFITYNLDGGDGKDTWVWTSSSERYRFDVSKLDQWEMVFAHMDSLGIQMHFLTQETENDGNLGGNGSLNNIRKLYYHEIISRYAHHLGVLWNMGEENTNSDAQRASFAQYFHEHDPYDNPVTVHTLNNPSTLWEDFYDGILSNPSYLQYFEVASLQGNGSLYNSGASGLRSLSELGGRKWVICGDEQTPDVLKDLSNINTLRKETLWGNLMGGGGGIEWYFGYQSEFGDLQSEDFREVDLLWDQTKIALDFFHNNLPFDEMQPDNTLFTATNGFNSPGGYCLANPGEVYAVYVKPGFNNVVVSLNIAGTDQYTVKWFNPRIVGALQDGTPAIITATNGIISLGTNPANDNNDWVALVKKIPSVVPAPEINLRHGSTNIQSGQTYTFPNTQVSASRDVVFTIQNTGNATLNVSVPLTAGGDFSIISQPSSTVSALGNATFTVRFTPTAAGVRTGAVTISSDDSDEGSYILNLTGSGIVLAPEINVEQNVANILSGGTYAFANTQIFTNNDVVFTVENAGTATLTLSTPLTASGDFSIISQPAASVAVASSTTFTVRFTPSATGARTGAVTITNNDNNEGSYLVNFSGDGVPPPNTTWTGSVSNDWFDNSNWTYTAPDATLDAIIPDVSPGNFPVVAGPAGTIAHVKNLTIGSGAQLTISNLNNVELIIHADLSNNGQVLGTGRMTFNGPAHSISSPVSFSGILQVKAGSTLNTNGNLTLEDGASLLHGTGTPGGSGTVAGSVKLKRTGNTGSQVYTYWSSPVAGTSVSALGGNRYYYEPTNATDQTVTGLRAGWVSASGSMLAGKGYISQGTPQITFDGVPQEGNFSVSVSKSGATSVAWNLVGNPYPSGLNASSFVTANAGTIYGSLYFWDDDASGGNGWTTQDYAVWNFAGSVSGPNSGTVFNGHIAAGQGFFVEKIAAGTGSVQFANSMRSDQNSAFFRQAPVERIKLSAVGPTGFYNETLIAFIDDATDSLDVLYDAKKLKGNDKISLYTKNQNGLFAIQGLPLLADDRIVTLGIDAGVTGNYTLEVRALENFDESVTVMLEDTYLGVFQNLRLNPEYVFSAAVGNYEERFKLHFTPPLKVEATEETCAGNDGIISITQPGSKFWNYTLLNENGFVLERKADFNGTEVFAELAPGLYMLKLIDNEGYFFTKEIAVAAKQHVTAAYQAGAHVNAGTPVSFSNLSTGATGYQWEFGDGESSNEMNPVHVYLNPGTYDVTLLAANPDCSEEVTSTVQVMKQEMIGTGINDIEDAGVQIYGGEENSVYVKTGKENAQITIYDLTGKRLYSGKLPGGKVKIELPYYSGNYCFVRVQCGEKSYSKKVAF